MKSVYLGQSMQCKQELEIDRSLTNTLQCAFNDFPDGALMLTRKAI